MTAATTVIPLIDRPSKTDILGALSVYQLNYSNQYRPSITLQYELMMCTKFYESVKNDGILCQIVYLPACLPHVPPVIALLLSFDLHPAVGRDTYVFEYSQRMCVHVMFLNS